VLESSKTSTLSEPELFCYDLLSLGNYNYTTAVQTDTDLFNTQTLILPSDPTTHNQTGNAQIEYLNFVKSGRNMVVLGTGEAGFFAELFFQKSNTTLQATAIQTGTETIELPTTLQVSELNIVGSNVEILSSYECLDRSCPFILKLNIGSGQLFYVNIDAIYNFMINCDKPAMYPILGKLLGSIALSVSQPQPKNVDGFTSSVEVGDVIVNTETLLFSSSATWVDDGNDKILKFDGKSDYLVIENSQGLNCSGKTSIFAWVKTTKDNGIIFAKYLNDNITWPGYAFGFGIWTAGNLSYCGRLQVTGFKQTLKSTMALGILSA
jgi:hypothetical protein